MAARTSASARAGRSSVQFCDDRFKLRAYVGARTRRIDDSHAPGLGTRPFEIHVADPREELALLALELVESAPPGEALARDHHRHVEDQRPVEPDVASRKARLCGDRLLVV